MKNEIKEISIGWQNAFPDLTRMTPKRFVRIVGCFAVEIYLYDCFSSSYKPYVILYPLWKEGARNCFDIPYIYREVENRKGLQFSIYYSNNEEFEEAVECTKRQGTLFNQTDIRIDELFSYIDNYSQDSLVITRDIEISKLFELKLRCALYINNGALLKAIKKELLIAVKSWDQEDLNYNYGSFDNWLKEMLSIEIQREEMLLRIKENLQEKKLKNLRRYELVK